MPRKSPATQPVNVERLLPELRRRFGAGHIRPAVGVCEYADIHGDAAIRVCTTHDPGFGLHRDEYCQHDERRR